MMSHKARTCIQNGSCSSIDADIRIALHGDVLRGSEESNPRNLSRAKSNVYPLNNPYLYPMHCSIKQQPTTVYTVTYRGFSILLLRPSGKAAEANLKGLLKAC